MTSSNAPSDPVPGLRTFIDGSPTPFHAVSNLSLCLRQAGFEKLEEAEEWRLEPGSRAFVTKDGGTLVAFMVGRAAPADAGFVVLCAHTDSPGLRLKPLAEIRAAPYRQLAVEVYGSPLWHSWLDRELGIAGRVCDRDGIAHLVRLDGPVCIIPSLAIHLNREVNSQGLQLDAQQHLNPIWRLGAEGTSLVELLAAHLSRTGARTFVPDDILAYDLCLFDHQPTTVVGPDEDLLCAPRLDNLLSCFAVQEALLGSRAATNHTQVAVFYDHEEVGSRSSSGAQSRFFLSVLERVIAGLPGATAQGSARAFARSLLGSVDMAHGVHPNWADKHDPQHRPVLGGGPVIKSNVSQSYATGAPATAAALRACQKAGVAPQRFASRNDMACGTTVGPTTAARLAMPSVDLGNAMLAMHSCRELTAAADLRPLIDVLAALLRPEVDEG